MVDIDSPILVQEPFLDRPTPKPNRKHAIKPILIFIICFIVLSLIAALTVTILVGKKKQATSSYVSRVVTSSYVSTITTSSYVSTVVTSTGTITHAFPTIITNASSTTIKYPSTTSITYTSSTTIKSSVTQTTAATTFANSTTNMMIPSTTSDSKPSRCQLPLIPTYNSNKVIVTGGDSPGSRLYELNKPIALALDSKSNLFVLDYNNHRVMKYSPNSKNGEKVLGHGTDRYPRATYIFSLFIDVNDVLYTFQRFITNEFIIWPSSSKNGTVILPSRVECYCFTMDRDLNIYIIFHSGVLTEMFLSIFYAPRYEEVNDNTRLLFKRQPPVDSFPTSPTNIYLDSSNNLYLLIAESYSIMKTVVNNGSAETVLDKTSKVLAFTVDCHNNLYTIDSNASLIIYNSTADVISIIHNVTDTPMDKDFWPDVLFDTSSFFREEFARLVLDSTTGDLYVIMYPYDRVTKLSLDKQLTST